MAPPTDEQLRKLRHMLGLTDRYKRDPQPYRNHWSADGDSPELEEMVRLGLCERRDRVSFVPGVTYYATEEGKRWAMRSAMERRKPKGARTWATFLRCSDSDPDLTFREFITSPDYAEIRRNA